MSLPRLNAPSLSVPMVSAARLQAPTLSKRYYIKQQERRHVKDLGDIFLGDPLTGTKQLRETLVDHDAISLVYTPILNRIAGTWFLYKERTLDPIFKEGDMYKAFINNLETFGSTLDTLSNPIKALMPWAGGGSTVDLSKSMGWVEGAYRETYQWDTGNWLLDVAGEIISDPANWFSLGGKLLTKLDVTDAIKNTDDILRKNTGKLFVGGGDSAFKDTAFIKNLNEELAATVADPSERLINDLMERAYSNRDQLLKQIDACTNKSLKKKMLADLGDMELIMANDFKGNLVDLTYKIRNQSGWDAFKAITKVKQFGEGVDSAVLKLALVASPMFGGSIAAFKYIVKPSFEAMRKNGIAKLKALDPSKVFPNNIRTHYKEVLDNAARQSYSMHAKTYANFESLFKKYNFDKKKLLRMYKNIWYSLQGSEQNFEKASSLFLEQLFKRVPELEQIYKADPKQFPNFAETVLNKLDLEKDAYELWQEHLVKKFSNPEDIQIQNQQALDLLHKSDIDELLEVVEEYNLVTELNGQDLKRMMLDNVTRDFKEFLTLSNLEDGVASRIKFITDTYMKVDGVQYTLKELPEFLDALNKSATPDYYAQVVSILDYFGITIDSAPVIKEYVDAIEKIRLSKIHVGKLEKRLSNLHRDLKRWITTHPDANLEKYNLLMEKVDSLSLLVSTTVASGDITLKSIRKDLLTEINTLINLLETNTDLSPKYVRHLLNQLQTFKDNYYHFDYDPTDALVKLLENNKKGNLMVEYDFDETQQILKTYRYDTPTAYDDTIKELESYYEGSKAGVLDDVKEANTNAIATQKTIHKNLQQIVDDYLPYLHDHDIVDPTRSNYLIDASTRDAIKKQIEAEIAMIPEPSKDLPYKEYIEARAYKAAKEEALLNMDRPTIRQRGILTELDTIDNYSGSDDTAIDYITHVLENTFDDSHNIVLFDEQYQQLYKRIKRWRSPKLYEQLSTRAQQFVDDLNNLTIADYVAPYTTDIAILKQTKSHWLRTPSQTLVSNFKKTWTSIIDHYNSWEPETQVWFKTLMDPKNDYLRNQLEQIAKILDSNGLGPAADNIDHVLVSLRQIQPLVHIENTLRTKYSELLNKEQCNYVINLIYDLLYNSDLTATQAFDPDTVSLFMKKYRHQMYDFGQSDYIAKAYQDTLIKRGVDIYDYSNPLTDTTQFLQTLLNDVERVFKVYFESLTEIATSSRLTVTVAPMANVDQLMSRIAHLADSYDDMMKIVQDPRLQNALTKFVTNMGGTRMVYKNELLRVANEVQGTLQPTAKSLADPFRLKTFDITDEEVMNNGLHLQHSSAVMNRYGIYDAIKDSFRKIGLQNAELAGTTDYFKIPQAGVYKTRKLGNITKLITQDNVDTYITNVNIATNAFDYSLANDLGLTFKHVDVPPVFANGTERYVNTADTSGLYDSFITAYNDALAFIDRSDEFMVTEASKLKTYRSALANAYLHSDLPYAPVDAKSYFKNISDKNVLAWHMLTNGKVFNQAVSARYAKDINKKLNLTPFKATAKDPAHIFSIKEKIDYNEDPMSLYKSLENKSKTLGFTSETLYNDEIQYTAYEQFSNIRAYASKDFKKWVKDPDTLLANSYNIITHKQQNVDAWEWVRNAEKVATDNRTIAELNLTNEQNLLLKTWGITPGTKVKDPIVQKYLTNEREYIRAASLKSWSADELRSYLDYDTQDYGLAFVVDPATDATQGPTESILRKYSKEELRRAGLSIYQPFKDAPHIHMIKKDKGHIAQRAHIHKYYRPRYIFKEQQNQITGLFKRNQHYFEYDGTRIDPNLYTGAVFTQDELNLLFEVPAIKKILGPLAERKLYSKAFAEGSNSNFIPNTLVIGSADATNELYRCIAQHVQDFRPVFHSSEISRLAYHGNHVAIARANNAVKYLETIFNKDYWLGAEHWQAGFKNATDAEIEYFFEKNRFVAMVAKEAEDGKPIIYRWNVKNKKDFMEAAAQGAVGVPHEIYRNAVLVINKRKMSSPFLKVYRRTIAPLFKSIYITSIGQWFRNEIDSAIYKNMNSSEGLASALDWFVYQQRASKLWKWYNDVQRAMRDSTKTAADSIGTLNNRVVRKHLAKMSLEDQRLYRMIDIFAMSSASGGLSKALEEMLLQYNTLGSIDMEAWEQVLHDYVQNKKISPVYWASEINGHIEQTSRLALFLKIVEDSGDYAKAISDTVRTHIDYELREPGFQLFEDIFWFSTFPINNMYYYLNEGLTKNPDMIKAYMDMLEQSWNNGDITWDDVRKNRYYAYNAMRGNLRFKIKGKTIILKTSSSVLDYLNILANPFEEASQRLNPFLSVLLGIEPIKELNPATGQFYRAKQLGVGPGKSLIPSLYMESYPNHNYNYSKIYYRTDDTRRTWLKYPKKLKKPANIDYMRYRFLTNAFFLRRYTRPWQSWKAYAPNWFKYNYRSYRSQGKLNRTTRKLKLPVYSK